VGAFDLPNAPTTDAGGAVSYDAGRPAVDAGSSDSGATAFDAGGGLPTDAGPVDFCASVTCQANAACDRVTGHCACVPGFQGTTCTPIPPGSPAARTAAEVCTARTASLPSRANGDGFTTSTATCDPGQLSRDALDDTLARLNFFRWLVGLGPTTDDTSDDAVAQKCALISAWNPAGPSAHFPQPSATCYSTDGAAGAGSSNIAWGSGSGPDAIDQWMIDNGNQTTFGHRRWLLNPPLGPVGIGFYRGGNNYGSASCIRVFGGSGSAITQPLTAFPPPGFSPAEFATWPWTIHGDLPASMSVIVTASDGGVLPTQLNVLTPNYGQNAAFLDRQGWAPVAGEVYRVTVSGSGVPDVSWDVKPVSCP
jgi:uncharacterized protein YkwD